MRAIAHLIQIRSQIFSPVLLPLLTAFKLIHIPSEQSEKIRVWVHKDTFAFAIAHPFGPIRRSVTVVQFPTQYISSLKNWSQWAVTIAVASSLQHPLPVLAKGFTTTQLTNQATYSYTDSVT